VVSYQKLRTLPKLSTRTRMMLKEVNIKIFIMKTGEREEPLVHFDINCKFRILINQFDWNQIQN
jgi:hypothetical protein